MPPIPKVLTVHDEQLDEAYRESFATLLASTSRPFAAVDVRLGDFDPELPLEVIPEKIRDEYLRDSSVTVVLVGAKTWQQRHVDWVVASTLLERERSPRRGLIGIVLPSYYDAHFDGYRGCYDPCTIPPRLHDNIEAGFASMHDWTDDPARIEAWLHRARERGAYTHPDNRRDLYRGNRTAERWRL